MRPEGWDKKRCDYLHLNTADSSSVENICTYEAGADAMLEGLKKESFIRKITLPADTNITNDLTDFEITKSGYLVFIPEE